MASARAVSDDAAAAGEDIARCLDLAVRIGNGLPAPGAGATLERWRTLAAIGRANLTAARVLEAHSDALAILGEAGVAGGAAADGTWGVFAAEAPGRRLVFHDGRLDGVKPWCSLGDRLDHALVTAHVGDARQLFRVDLRADGVRAAPPERWVARGLQTVTSVELAFTHVPAEPVGDPGWYLERDGFAWGGIGVAACWFGGAQGVADALLTSGTDSELVDAHRGAVDAQLFAASAALEHAAAEVDAGRAAAAAGAVLALRTRAVVASAAEAVLHHVGHALGPAPLAFDAAHAARVADLQLYLRQHHGERDLAALGRALRP